MTSVKRILTGFLAALILLLITGTAHAQTYSFQMPREIVDVYIEADGSVTIDYSIDFLNEAGASPLDFVDIGLPNDRYKINTITADIDGIPITDITHSDYVDYGVARGLGANAIQPGRSGTVTVHIPGLTGLISPGTQKESEDYASFQFMPNYFGSQYVHGKTYMEVALHLPPDIQTEEPRYFEPKNWPGSAAPESSKDQEGRIYYLWTSDQASGSAKYTFGCAFPARVVPASAITTPPAKTINTEDVCCVGLVIGGLAVLGLVIYGSITSNRKRKLQYLPPKISVEGNGIKRGLTAIEAAILMEQPVDKILTMILFSTIKKEAVVIESRDPLKLQIANPLPDTLQPYEVDFLKAMEKEGRERQTLLKDLLVTEVKSVSDKMKGFSRKETVAYYQKIVDQAWDYVEKAETPEVRMKKYDEVMDWTMLDRDYDDHTRDIFTSPVRPPIWWWRFDPTFNRPMTSGTGGGVLGSPTPSSTGGTITMPTLPGSDFAVSMVNGIQKFSSNVVGDITQFTDKLTQVTNPAPRTPTSSSSNRSGRSGGCACACACACAGCACACAGGGR